MGHQRESLGPQWPRAFSHVWEWPNECSQDVIALPNLTSPWESWGFGYGLGSLAFGCADAWFDALAPDYGNKKGTIWKISHYENV